MFPSSLELMCISQRLAQQEEHADVRPYVYKRATLDALVASSRGYKVLSLMGLDEAGNIAHWHWPTDTIANVDVSLAEKAAAFATAIVSALDE